MIVLRFPDGSSRQLDDDDARQLADRLWVMADGARTATVAAAIERELRRDRLLRQSIEIPEMNVSRVTEALA